MALPLVAIVGRPNVGKSTLFNRLVGARSALVADLPGLTRDRHYGTVRVADRPFDLVDTGGFEPDAEGGIEGLIASQTQLAIDEADLILMLLDARTGLTGSDEQIAAVLRRCGRPVLHVANKVDGPQQRSLVGEIYRIGASRVWEVSAEHALGVDDLLEGIAEALPPGEDQAEQRPTDEVGIRFALVGRPNAGKSALLNRLVGAERSIVSEVPGTTRDPVDVRLQTEQGPLTVVDTAGLRRKRRAGPALEQLAGLWARRRIGDAHVACLVIDAAVGVTIQDAKIAALAMEAGRALLIVHNKSDLLGPLGPARKRLQQQAADKLGFASFAPTLLLSAQTGKGVGKLLPTVWRAHQNWGARIPTAELNRLLEEAVLAHHPPAFRGRPLRFYFVSQPQTRPPTFVFSTSHPDGVPQAYRRYLANRLRDRYGFEGTPLRLLFRAHREHREPKRPQRRRKRR
jgi:GTP-binding protein